MTTQTNDLLQPSNYPGHRVEDLPVFYGSRFNTLRSERRLHDDLSRFFSVRGGATQSLATRTDEDPERWDGLS